MITHTVSFKICRNAANIGQVLILLLHQLHCDILLDRRIHIIRLQRQRQWQWMSRTYWRSDCEFIIATAIQIERIIWMRKMRIVAQLIDFDAGQYIHHIRFVHFGK